MGKSSRSSRLKTNNRVLKKKVFGPVETARTERLNAKLLALAKAPQEQEMKEATEADNTEDPTDAKPQDPAPMDVDAASTTGPKKPRSKREVKRLQDARATRQVNTSRKRPRNMVTFPPKPGRKNSKK